MELLDLLGEKEIWVTGKGGIGKTTTAAALALHYAQNDERVLVFDVDGYHSMQDSLAVEPQEGFRFKIPENKRYPLFDELGVDLDLCLVSPSRIVEQVQSNRVKHHANRTHGLAPYFGILHLYDVLDQLGTFVASKDLAALCLICNERALWRNSPGQARFIYDNQSSNATIDLIARATSAVGRLDAMKQHKTRWNLGARAAGWPDMSAFVKDDYVDKIDRYIAAFEDLGKTVRDPAASAYLIVTGARRTELTETHRLVQELQEGGYPVQAVLVNRLASFQEKNLDPLKKGLLGVPVFFTPDLPVFESDMPQTECLGKLIRSVERYSD